MSCNLMPVLLAHIVEHKSSAYFLAVPTSKVGSIFVGEIDRRLSAPKNDYRRICAIRLVKLTPVVVMCQGSWPL